MGKNIKGGKKQKRAKNKTVEIIRKLTTKTHDQDYMLVTSQLGDGRVRGVLESDGRTILGIVRGSIRKRTRLKEGDYVLISFRDYQTDKVDILYKYFDYEIYQLIDRNHIKDKNISATDDNNSFIIGDTKHNNDKDIIFHIPNEDNDKDIETMLDKL